MKKILLIEDNQDLSREIKKFIENFQYQVKIVESLKEARESLKEKFDIALLDINLPDGQGIEILSLLKSKGIKTIITTVKNDEDFIINSLDNGADDYIVKPFSLAVLRARIDLALRESLIVSDKKIEYKNFLLDKENKYIFLNGEKLDLSVKESDILSLFIKNPHKIFTREFLLERFWDSNENYVNDNTLTVTIKRIREKIKEESITTIRGIGYKLD
ncbi:MAG: response regulator transcription factor [Peptoniphilaceae bacterium]